MLAVFAIVERTLGARCLGMRVARTDQHQFERALRMPVRNSAHPPIPLRMPLQ